MIRVPDSLSNGNISSNISFALFAIVCFIAGLYILSALYEGLNNDAI